MAKVYVVHRIDTEGPLNETLEATFARINAFCGGSGIEPTLDNLRKIQAGELDLNGKEELAKFIFCPRFLNYNRTWQDLDKMLDEITSEDFRQAHADSQGRGWQYSWFVIDHPPTDYNPRNRDIGWHNIYDHYQSYYRRHRIQADNFQWHAHPMNAYKNAAGCGNSFISSPHIWQSLARRLVDRGFFPSAYSAGFHAERPDSHWLLEQYIPYDFSNQAMELTDMDKAQAGVGDGRFGDWRRAPATWEHYHPSHDDYQLPGDCRRVIFRCLNVGTRLRCLTQAETDKAFARAADGKDTVLCFMDHDFRHIGADIDEVYALLQNAAAKFPQVEWLNATATEAARAVTQADGRGITLTAHIDNAAAKPVLTVQTDADTFGPQPFFVIKMRGERYFLDNLDFQTPRRKWTYTFDADSVKPEDVEAVGVAANSMTGTGALSVITFDNRELFCHRW